MISSSNTRALDEYQRRWGEYRDVLNEKHYDGYRREMKGEKILDRHGRVRDHITEVENTLRGLRDLQKQIGKRLGRQDLTKEERERAERMFDEVTEKTSEAVREMGGRGGGY